MSDFSWTELLAKAAEATEEEIAAAAEEVEEVAKERGMTFDEALDIVRARYAEQLIELSENKRHDLFKRVDAIHADRVAKSMVAEAEAAMVGLPDQIETGASIFTDDDLDGDYLWGSGDTILWQRGEALMIAGLTGVGKSTCGGRVVRGLLGLETEFLGFHMKPVEGRVLYLAMDRPRQIKRSLRRMFTKDELPVLDQRLRIWAGPPPADLAESPDTLLEMCIKYGAEVVVIDSLKDAYIGLTEDANAANWNRAMQRVISAGIDVMILHHTIKNWDGTLPGIYGSTHNTSGVGSVLGLNGVSGSGRAEMTHLKQVAGHFGTLQLEFDYVGGAAWVTEDHGQRVSATTVRDDGSKALILEHLGNHPGSSRSGVAEGLAGHVGRDKVSALLSVMVNDGTIEKTGDSARSTAYWLLEDVPRI